MFRTIVILAVACSLACGSKTQTNNSPVECQQYEAAFNACFHRNSGFASQAVVIPKSDADRERIRQLCLDNLQRIQRSCP